jgi:ribonuclease M5
MRLALLIGEVAMPEKKEKIKIPATVIVEGKYDKIKLSGIIDANIITTGGFGIFNSREKLSLIRAMGAAGGVVLLTDSDGAGGVIRSYIHSVLPPEQVYDLYIPKIRGKERRKSAPSREGTLGVEGMSDEMLREMFSALAEKHFSVGASQSGGSGERGNIKKADLYAYGLTGAENSSAARDRLCLALGLPDGMTPTAMLGALNILMSRDEFKAIAEKINDDGEANER